MRPANRIVHAAQFVAAPLFLATALFLAASVTHAQTNDQAALQITRLYRLSDEAADAQDSALAASLIGPDFVLIGPKGDRHDRTQILAGLKANYKQMQEMGFHTRTTTQIKTIRVSGGHADVLYSQHQILRHTARTLMLDTTGTEEWVHTPAGWKLAQSRVLTARQDKPTTSLLSPQEVAALNTLIAVRNRAALQNLDDSMTLFNQTLDIDRSQNAAASQQIREEEQRRRHREIYGY